jgi:hypothetical protein
MPHGRACQILAQDRRENDELGLEQVEDLVISEEEAVGDLRGDKGYCVCVQCGVRKEFVS